MGIYLGLIALCSLITILIFVKSSSPMYAFLFSMFGLAVIPGINEWILQGEINANVANLFLKSTTVASDIIFVSCLLLKFAKENNLQQSNECENHIENNK